MTPTAERLAISCCTNLEGLILVAAPGFPEVTTQARFVSRIGCGLTNSSGLASLCFLIFMLWEFWWSCEKLHLEGGTQGGQCTQNTASSVWSVRTGSIAGTSVIRSKAQVNSKASHLFYSHCTKCKQTEFPAGLQQMIPNSSAFT